MIGVARSVCAPSDAKDSFLREQIKMTGAWLRIQKAHRATHQRRHDFGVKGENLDRVGRVRQ